MTHQSMHRSASTQAQKSERMLGQALHPRWALSAICTPVSLPGLFACVSSAPLLSATLFRPFSMTCGNPAQTFFFFLLSNECTSKERLLQGFHFHSSYSTSADVGSFFYDLKILHIINEVGCHHRHKMRTKFDKPVSHEGDLLNFYSALSSLCTSMSVN